MSENLEHSSIKFWAEADRPREKLLKQGKAALTDAELLAIVLGSGSKNETAVELARRMLQNNQNNYHQLSRLSVKDLMKYKGIGEAKAISIVAVMEIANRRQLSEIDKKVVIKSSAAAAQFMIPVLGDLPHEEFWVLLLNRANRVIDKARISSGGVTGTVADIKMILKLAIESLASSIILFHNHPSGNLKPSEADKRLTTKLKNAAELMDIAVADHLIIAGKEYFSFLDNNLQ